MSDAPLRRVRSFVRRPGRITAAQQRARERLMPRFAVDRQAGKLDLPRVFGRDARRVLDIGFGDGEALLTTAANHSEIDYLGVEVHEPGIGHLLLLLEQAGLDNVRIIEGDATDVLPEMIDDATLDAVNLFFPDPWPKKRHHKRRLVQPVFLDEIARALKIGGLFHFATDWADYAEHTRCVFNSRCDFEPVSSADVCHNPLAFRAPTKFEGRGRRLGHDIVDLYFHKKGPRAS